MGGIIILSAIVFCWVLTFIIPQGSYQRISDSNGITRVVSNSYQPVKQSPPSFFNMFDFFDIKIHSSQFLRCKNAGILANTNLLCQLQ